MWPLQHFRLPLLWISIILVSVTTDRLHGEEKSKDLERLQGTWKTIAVEFHGVRSAPKLEKTWIFNGKELSTQLGKLPPIVFEIEVNGSADLKELDMRQRGIPKGEPDRLGFRFVGDTLEVVQGKNLNQRPKSFDTKDETNGLMISVFAKTTSNGKVPPSVTPHSKNAEAEAVLLKFFTAILKRESVESIEPYVGAGKAMALFALLPTGSPTTEAIADEMKLTGVRDVQAGERIYYANGTEKVVVAEDLTDSKTLLMLVQGQRDAGFFWVYQEQKTWKVDTTNMIELLRNPGRPLFRGIRAGMELTRARKLLDDYRSSGAFTSYKRIRETDSELVVELVDNEVPTRLSFSIVNGKLTNVVTASSFKSK